ncbi:hypothetical protein [Fulvivirga sedimenti]|uniref:DUF1080 domain-containing protein n=1 Tax=Fulvivirga sedimenti TaxID=2879465 RepID=A0A9X1HNC9_9BACT|nr:hypothetical protein [Fulvivirga sedimenti]MCA6073767.1 hypothetical protein [Fulvivirga sedimenti]
MLIPKYFLLFFIMLNLQAHAQQKVHLADMFREDKISPVNREISLYDEHGVEMDARDSDGLGIIQGVEFKTGTIEIELLGENNPGKSFIGVAFNIQDNETYEAVYFRPFNFVAEEEIRRAHMVQYIFHPEFTWRKLREERTGEFEKEIPDPPDPDNWFRAVIRVSETRVEVFVEGSPDPVLVVDRLNSTSSGKIAIWTGFGSSGRFRNLVIKSE